MSDPKLSDMIIVADVIWINIRTSQVISICRGEEVIWVNQKFFTNMLPTQPLGLWQDTTIRPIRIGEGDTFVITDDIVRMRLPFVKETA